MGDTPSTIIAQLTFFSQPPLSEHLSLCVDCLRWRFVYIWWMIGFLDTDENEYYFLFFLFVSSVRVLYICPGVGNPYWLGISSSLFFLGVAIGLELRIRLWHMLWLAFVFLEKLRLRGCWRCLRLRILSGGHLWVVLPARYPSSASSPSTLVASWSGGSGACLPFFPFSFSFGVFVTPRSMDGELEWDFPSGCSSFSFGVALPPQ